MMPVPKILCQPADCILETTREVDAPVTTVFKAWTDPMYFEKWWGPKDFTTKTHAHDLRPGGRMLFDICSNDGQAFPNECVFVAIEPPHRVIWDHISGHFFQVVATFTPIDDAHSRVTFQMVFETAEECRRVGEFAREKNEENMDKMEQVLKEMKKDKSGKTNDERKKQ